MIPSSRKFFHARNPSSRKSTITFVISFITLLCICIAVLKHNHVDVYRSCKYTKPASVSVVWDQTEGSLVNDKMRYKVMAFVGIQTGFSSNGRRLSLRKTWFPSDHQALQRLEESTGMAFRFVIGKTRDKSKMAELRKEVEEYDDFLLLDIEEEYSKLPYKTLAFFKAAYALYDSDFYVKADDDIYLRPDRLSLLLAKERHHTQTYLGCMKKGPVFTDPKMKWHEPLGYMIGKEYFLHAYGPIYALSADVVASLVALRNNRLEESTGMAFRFVIGKTRDKSKMAELRKEVEEYDDLLLLDIEEEYSKLPYKTLAFFKAAYALYDSDFYVKADDDIYLRPDRLSLLLAKERHHTQTYLGCMKKGPVFTDPKMKWHEPLGYMIGKEYFLHAYGPIYALSADVVASLVALRNNSFRMFSNEDVTIGAWMLAMNVTHENNRQLCQPECTDTSIAVWDIPKCSGLCNPEKKMLELHQMKICSDSPALVSDE
ncbi:galactosyltransferase family protein [Artemisia annua]|uniref:Hexosyltransferase n=1 Tax=Artemisia annua TaxID=35608 RepID=A0A2U1PG09_ARTAN|nr:galactosyltransferase family protein [Artemisia annua]